MSDEPKSSEPRDPWAPPADVPPGPAAETRADAAPPAAWAPADSAGVIEGPFTWTPAAGAPGAGAPLPFPPSAPPGPAGPPGLFPPYSPYPQFPPPSGPPGYGGYSGYPAHPGYPMPPYGGWPPGAVPRNGFGVTALVLGIIGAVLAIACFGAFLGLPLGIAALVFGIIGLRTVKRGQATNRGQALAGVILGAVAVAVSAAMIALVIGGIASGWFNSDNVITPDRGEQGSPISEGEDVTYSDGLRVTVSGVGAADVPAQYTKGGNAVRFTVTVENTGTSTANLDTSEMNAYGDPADEKPLRDVSTDAGLPPGLRANATATTEVIVVVPAGADGPMEIEIAPGYDYDYAYWDVTVP
ncbi:DUF4190 domain-containing protein [Actinacidiphila oryziradicis]|uniref:DUF4190 domain-containing protein n=1 Tax=Actinacidiphila oryziradicis TaxID=2571141 RepID=A0A4V5MYN2_9ACTN|nr:DUF4190 domain-containing protein [Actinacidiphila oryziradicis]TKA04879.1 DUF4190 domain-containing protein [Actinacidiphila oryziradicis]